MRNISFVALLAGLLVISGCTAVLEESEATAIADATLAEALVDVGAGDAAVELMKRQRLDGKWFLQYRVGSGPGSEWAVVVHDDRSAEVSRNPE